MTLQRGSLSLPILPALAAVQVQDVWKANARSRIALVRSSWIIVANAQNFLATYYKASMMMAALRMHQRSRTYATLFAWERQHGWIIRSRCGLALVGIALRGISRSALRVVRRMRMRIALPRLRFASDCGLRRFLERVRDTNTNFCRTCRQKSW